MNTSVHLVKTGLAFFNMQSDKKDEVFHYNTWTIYKSIKSFAQYTLTVILTARFGSVYYTANSKLTNICVSAFGSAQNTYPDLDYYGYSKKKKSPIIVFYSLHGFFIHKVW